MSIQQELSAKKNLNSQPSVLTNEAIILAGGLGTRLRTSVPDLPKCMAPVAGRPFLYYVINYLRMQGIEKIIFSLGYMHHVILKWLKEEYPTLNYDFVIEDEPLGTGGAIQFALQKATTQNVFIANGDTLFKFDAASMLHHHQTTNAICTLALKPMQNFDRYGVVELNADGRISSFLEKKYYDTGLINAGLYLISKQSFLQKNYPKKFSFEKDFLEKSVTENTLSGIIQHGYFIDIGIPEDFNRAQSELAQTKLSLSDINKEWTLFLDRDGVINHDNPGGYITKPDEFRFMNGLPELFKVLSEKFKRIIIVTNQRGVGRGIIQYDDLIAMNQKMLAGIEQTGCNIDKIYFCTDIDNKSFYRKPNPGMMYQAINDFSDIDLSRSLIVGNSLSDMELGRYAGIYTVFVTTTNPTISLPHNNIDLIFDDLNSFAKSLQ